MGDAAVLDFLVGTSAGAVPGGECATCHPPHFSPKLDLMVSGRGRHESLTDVGSQLACDSWLSSTSRCYTVYDKKMGWIKARQRCQKAGGDLAIVIGKEDEDALVRHARHTAAQLTECHSTRDIHAVPFHCTIDHVLFHRTTDQVPFIRNASNLNPKPYNSSNLDLNPKRFEPKP